ncbi:UNVERIFIED_ORG: hypothetical protein ABIB52_001035 [Arthrobacter sp. UYCu721]
MDARLGRPAQRLEPQPHGLGDFNLDRIGDPLYEAFVNTGPWPPTELNTVPGTIFDDNNTRHFYDQIACFANPDGACCRTWPTRK